MSGVRIRVDGRDVEVPANGTLRDAAAAHGIAIPTLCHREGEEPSASCLACVVRERVSGRMLPACAVRPAAGMAIETDGPEVRESRRTAVELLLGDHVGDCEAPCRRGCPAGVDVPLVIRQVGLGEWGLAARTMKERVALPGSLTHICSVPCEHACRRARHDGAVAICLIERAVADADLRDPWVPPVAPASGKRVAIVGAGPAGLTAAYFLRQRGHACTLIERGAQPGGILRGGGAEGAPPARVVDGEIAVVRALGARIDTGRALGRDVALGELAADFDAVVLATGAAATGEVTRRGADWGVEVTATGVRIAAGSFAASRAGVFAAGSAVRPLRHVAVAAAQGRAAALAVDRHLAGADPAGERRRFSSVIGTLLEGEMAEFLAGADPGPPVPPAAGHAAGYTEAEAAREAARCLHCDCRRKEALPACARLRIASAPSSAASPGAGAAGCASCASTPRCCSSRRSASAAGSCVRAAARAGERLGLAHAGARLRVARGRAVRRDPRRRARGVGDRVC